MLILKIMCPYWLYNEVVSLNEILNIKKISYFYDLCFAMVHFIMIQEKSILYQDFRNI